MSSGLQGVFLRRKPGIVEAMQWFRQSLFAGWVLVPLFCSHAQEAVDGAGDGKLATPVAGEPQLSLAEVNRTGLLPPDTKILAQQAAEAFGKGDWNSARSAYTEMLELDGENSLAWANLGAVEQQAGRTDEAVHCFEKSVHFNPQLSQSWVALGLIASAQGDTYRAVSMLTRAIHEDPQDARAHNHLAVTMQSLGWRDAAALELQRAIELAPDYGIAHFNLALMYLEQKPPATELARRHYEKALALGVEKDDIVERRLRGRSE